MTDPVPTPYSEHLLPRGATPLQIALSGSGHRMLSVPVWVIRACWDPDACPVHLLPYLAQAWSVDEWDPEWSEAQKRQVIKDAPALHKLKGTRGAVERAIEALGFGATLREWFEYGGQPYRFKISVTLQQGASWTAKQAALIWRTAIANKNVRSRLETISVAVPPTVTPLHIGVAAHARITIGNVIEELREIVAPNGPLYVGCATHARLHIGNVI